MRFVLWTPQSQYSEPGLAGPRGVARARTRRVDRGTKCMWVGGLPVGRTLRGINIELHNLSINRKYTCTVNVWFVNIVWRKKHEHSCRSRSQNTNAKGS